MKAKPKSPNPRGSSPGAPIPTTHLTAEEFEAKFVAGESVLEHVNLEAGAVKEPKMQKVNVDFPEWVVARLDAEAERIGVARQALIKMWIVQCLERRTRRRSH